MISGEIPSHDREGALFAIENRPIETFDFHHQQAATAHWTQANFEVLGPRLASELSEISGCGLRGCAYWVDLLFRYATTSPEKVERSRLLSDCVFGDLAGKSKNEAEEQLQSLIALLSLIEPVVLVFDETEGLSNQPDAGLRVAAFVVQLRQACPALTVILSVNEDVWQTGLSPLMPGGLEDRLTEFEVRLNELPRTEAENLLRSRFGKDSQEIAEKMDWPKPLSARAVLRNGAEIARTLTTDEEFSLEEPSVLAGMAAGTATPPPLDGIAQDFGQESFEEKAERILEPRSSFEAEEEVGFESVPRAEDQPIDVEEIVSEAPEVSKSPAEAPPLSVSADDPFGEPTQASREEEPQPQPQPQEQEASSPFAISQTEAPGATSEIVEQAPEEQTSPFTKVDDEPSEIATPAENQWSAESAVKHFAAAQGEPVSEPVVGFAAQRVEEEPPSQPATGSAFDEVPATAPAPEVAERSPFQQLEEEKSRLEAEAREKELAAARLKKEQEEKAAAAAAAVVESSPFSVSEPKQETPPARAPQAEPTPVQQPVQEVKPSPFTVREPEPQKVETRQSVAPVETAVAAASPTPEKAPQEPASPFVQKESAPAAQPASEATETPKTAQASSPFAAVAAPVSSPFASSASCACRFGTRSGNRGCGRVTEPVQKEIWATESLRTEAGIAVVFLKNVSSFRGKRLVSETSKSP